VLRKYDSKVVMPKLVSMYESLMKAKMPYASQLQALDLSFQDSPNEDLK
jgi:hypothetical protein